MFSANSFSEASFSELDTPIVASGITGGDVVIYFNNSFLTFPLEINRQADFNLDKNTQQDHSLGINKTLDFNAER
jgi:hypothetical protein|tara:strand:+ start:441 stop:665 length:225 start_codon:yes stop_codon:yes gene_type:complete